MKKVLVIETDGYIRSFAAASLGRAGYEPIEAASGEEGLERLQEHADVDLAVLDISLPDMDGLEVCRRLRGWDHRMGILMLPTRSRELDLLTGLMTGADDYLTKPFSPAALTARLEALERRATGEQESADQLLSSGPFLLNTHRCTLEKLSQPIRLTQPEYATVKLFLEDTGRALSREEIALAVWGDAQEDAQKVDGCIRRLRLKLEDDPGDPKYLTTIQGFGYKWGG